MKRGGLRVRVLGPEDWRTFRDVRLAALADAPDAFGSTAERERAFPEATWRDRVAASALKCSWLAESEGEPLGIVHAQLDAERPGRAWLMAMWVHPRARRRGVARALAEVVEAWALRQRASTLVLQVTDGNRAAESLYRALGYEPTGEQEALRSGSPKRALTLARALR
ncbi:MAG TPA: GNAT family N-acetyltransferase [Myxococcota bacterium]